MNKSVEKYEMTIGQLLIATEGLGKIKDVADLVSKSNSQDCNDALLAAIDEGQIECAKLLVPVHSSIYKDEKERLNNNIKGVFKHTAHINKRKI